MYNTQRLRYAFKYNVKKCDCRVIMLVHTKQMRTVADFQHCGIFFLLLSFFSHELTLRWSTAADFPPTIFNSITSQFFTIPIKLPDIDSSKHTSKLQLTMFRQWTFVELCFSGICILQFIFYRTFSYERTLFISNSYFFWFSIIELVIE